MNGKEVLGVKIRVGRSEIICFLNIFFMVFSIISVTTDAILAAARNHPDKIGSHSQSRCSLRTGSQAELRACTDDIQF